MKTRLLAFGFLALFLLSGCAYRLGPTNEQVAGAQTIAVDYFPNQSLEPQLTDLVATSVRREVQRDGTFRLATRSTADIVVTGTIIEYGRTPVGSKRDDVLTPTDYDVRITARVKAMRGTQTVYEGDVSGRAQVIFNADLNNAERENNPVAADNLARNLISSIAKWKLVNPRLIQPMLTLAFRSFAAAILILGSGSILAADWPQWRGLKRDGHTTEPLPDQLPPNATVKWRVPLAHGYAAPVVASDRLVVLDDAGGMETAHALDLATGKQLWSVPLGENYTDEFEPGPRCTPVVDGDSVYVQTTKGEFRCLRLLDGSTVWRTNFADFGAVWIPERNGGIGAASRRGNSGSPLVFGDRVLVQVGSAKGASIVAFDKLTGRVLWQSQDDLTTYSTPVLDTLAGRPQFVAATCEGLLALAPEDGSVLWRVPFKTGANRNVLTPVLLDDTVYFASHTTGMRAVRIQPVGAELKPEEAWLNRELKINLSSPVAVGRHLYGLGPMKDYVCVDRDTGQRTWSQPGFGDAASTIASGNRLLVLNDRGELLLLAANPEKYEELGRLQVCGKTYTHPALADGILYVRDPRELQAVRLQ